MRARGRPPSLGYHIPSPTCRRETGYLHATVRHGHGIVGQGVAGDLTVIGAGGWRKDVAGTYVIRVNGVVSLEGPMGKYKRSVVTIPHQRPRSHQVTPE